MKVWIIQEHFEGHSCILSVWNDEASARDEAKSLGDDPYGPSYDVQEFTVQLTSS